MPSTLTLLPAIEQALKHLHYGHVQIVVHDGQVVRIERVERIHLPAQPNRAEEQPTGSPGGVQTNSR